MPELSTNMYALMVHMVQTKSRISYFSVLWSPIQTAGGIPSPSGMTRYNQGGHTTTRLGWLRWEKRSTLLTRGVHCFVRYLGGFCS